MRNLILALIVFGALPFILTRPAVGTYLWCGLSYTNPHRYAWGWAYNFPFAAIVAGATFVGLLASKERQRIPWNGVTMVWAALVVWFVVTTFFALEPEQAWPGLEKVFKIQVMAFVTLMAITTRERLQWLIWAVTLSVGFFGVKGGIFAIATSGQYRIWGPPESFIYDNNTLALALVMIMPLWQYLRLTSESAWLRLAILGAMALTVFAVLASYSRGAFLAIVAMAALLALRSRGKVLIVTATLVIVPIAISFMPEEYFERLETIRNYQADASAMGRINAWQFAYNLALDRPLVGGGFEAFDRELFAKYAPNPLDFHDAHSIYFEILGEQGFVGLALFLALFIATFRTAGRLRQQAPERKDLQWARDLGSMIQVCLAGYAVGGTFLGLAYFDLPYHLVALTVLARIFVERRLAESPDAAPVPEDLAVDAPPRAAEAQ